MSFVNYIKKNANKFFTQTKKIPVPIKIIVYGYFLLLAFSYLVYLIVVLAAIFFGLAKVSDLHTYITDLTSPAVIAAVLFVSKFFIDKDGNGLPDVLEDDKRKENKSNERL